MGVGVVHVCFVDVVVRFLSEEFGRTGRVIQVHIGHRIVILVLVENMDHFLSEKKFLYLYLYHRILLHSFLLPNLLSFHCCPERLEKK